MKRIAAGQLAVYTLLLLPLAYGCNLGETENSTHYRAVKERDTAYLSLSIGEKRFYGKYEIRYGRSGKDEGDVRGKITGDTLLGDYLYKPYGGGKKRRTPFALLRKDGKLFLGKGVEGSYMNIPFYMPEIPIDYGTPNFIFEEVQP